LDPSQGFQERDFGKGEGRGGPEGTYRPDKLARGLSAEVGCWKGEGLLLFRERKAYLGAFRDTLAGVEAARVVLARVVRRLEGVT
jgi:hypothetical protein